MSILSADEQRALHEALDDEYKAWTIYDQVIHDFGPERPFINIRDAEARHIDALCALFRRYGVEVPANAIRGLGRGRGPGRGRTNGCGASRG
jgi:hypothetical protein